MGQDLIEMLIQHSGLPEDYARRRINEMVARSGKTVDNLTIEDLRMMAADLLQDIILNSGHDQSA